MRRLLDAIRRNYWQRVEEKNEQRITSGRSTR